MYYAPYKNFRSVGVSLFLLLLLFIYFTVLICYCSRVLHAVDLFSFFGNILHKTRENKTAPPGPDPTRMGPHLAPCSHPQKVKK